MTWENELIRETLSSGFFWDLLLRRELSEKNRFGVRGGENRSLVVDLDSLCLWDVQQEQLIDLVRRTVLEMMTSNSLANGWL